MESAAQARRAFADVEALTGRAEDVAKRLQDTRERNHFGAAIAESMRLKNADNPGGFRRRSTD